MDNKSLWKLTAASVSNVNLDDQLHELKSFSEVVAKIVITSNSLHNEEKINLGWFIEPTERTIKKRNFELHEFNSNDNTNSHNVFMVR